MAHQDSLEAEETPPPHLAIVGGGVAGCAAAAWAAAQGAQVTLINVGLPLGGTTVHTGVLPSRLLMSAATDFHRAQNPRFQGIKTRADSVDWAHLREHRARLVDEVSQRFHRQVVETHPNVELLEGHARFLDEQTLEVGGRKITPDHVLLTPGSHSQRPPIAGLAESGFLALRELFELEEMPEEVLFLETSPTALSLAQALSRLGCKVQVLTEKSRLFGDQFSQSICGALTTQLLEEGMSIECGVRIKSGAREQNRLVLEGSSGKKDKRWSTKTLVYVDHRKPATEGLDLHRAGVELTDEGFIAIDETLQTTNPRIFAAGDAIGHGAHAFAAAYDAVLAARNAIAPSRRAGHLTVVPFAIYTDPELASVGWDAHQARAIGFETDHVSVELGDIPAAGALGARQGLLELCRDRRSDQLLGARILAPHASELIMEVALALRAGMTTKELSQLVHPAISLGAVVAYGASLFTD